MRIVIQRVQNASVSVENKVIGEIDEGYMILVGAVSYTHLDVYKRQRLRNCPYRKKEIIPELL